MSRGFRFCPRCAQPLETAEAGGMQRLRCTDGRCGFVHWDNPIPVVAAIVEHEGRIVLARNKLWPEKMFGLITGFLERKETPEVGVVREVREELDLEAEAAHFIGHYDFPQMNQLIIAFHVPATGSIRLNEELAEYKHVAPEKLRPWPTGTGHAVRDWLRARGYTPEERPLSPLHAIPKFLPLGERIGTAGQPDREQFALIKEAGFEAVVNLARADSTNAIPDERDIVIGLGLQYVQIPVDFDGPTDEDLQQFFSVMDRYRDKKVFVHCAANMRVSAFLYLYRRLRLGLNAPDAEAALHRIWDPNPVWQAFIDRQLRRGNP